MKLVDKNWPVILAKPFIFIGIVTPYQRINDWTQSKLFSTRPSFSIRSAVLASFITQQPCERFSTRVQEIRIKSTRTTSGERSWAESSSQASTRLKLRLHVISHVRVDGQWLAQVVVACISHGRGQGKWNTTTTTTVESSYIRSAFVVVCRGGRLSRRRRLWK